MAESDHERPEVVRTSRTALYERVWTTPVRDLAREFGLSSGGFSALCRREEIPLPVQGYWNRGPEGRKALRVPLPEPVIDRAIEVRLSPERVARAAAPSLPKGLVVPDRLVRPHALIRQTRSRLRTAPKDQYGRYRPGVGCVHILVGFRRRQRAYRIMDTVLKECEARGWTVRIEDRGLLGAVVSVDGGEVSIGLEEVIRRKPHRFTEEERAGAKKAGRPYGMQVYERGASGDLALSLRGWYGPWRRTWREGARFRLENLLGSFFKGLQEAGAWQKWQEEARAKVAVRRREEERARRELVEECEKEEARVAALMADAEAWAKSRTLRAFIRARVSSLRANGVETGDGTETGRWALWARVQADRLDPLVKSPPSILDRKPSKDG